MTRIKTAGLVTLTVASLFLQMASAHATDAMPKRPPQFYFIDFPDALTIAVPAAVFTPVPGAPQPLPGTGSMAFGLSTLKDRVGNVQGKQVVVCGVASLNSSLGSEPPGEIYVCTHTLDIAGKGKIVLSGAVNRSAFHTGITQSLPIVGGSGMFRTARGEVLTYESDIDPNIHVFEVYLMPYTTLRSIN